MSQFFKSVGKEFQSLLVQSLCTNADSRHSLKTKFIRFKAQSKNKSYMETSVIVNVTVNVLS